MGRTYNVDMLIKGKYWRISPVYVWKAETGTCVNVDLGKVCPDEILEISFDTVDHENRHYRFFESQSADNTHYQAVTDLNTISTDANISVGFIPDPSPTKKITTSVH